ncbi:MAG: O-antigen ligase family protein [Nitrospirae bacterium]|nr:O-antigen ligase family protein [Nitrospirota bacterium]
MFLIPFIPLVVTPSALFPYITGKNFAFRILVEFAAALWVPLILAYKQYRLNNSPMLISILFFTFIVGLADLFGVSPYNSFWSNYERMEGYITILHLTLFFMIISSVLRCKKDWIIFFNIFVAVSMLVSSFALIASLQAANSPQFAMIYGQRIYGTIGNPTFFASYLMLSMFIAFILIFNTQRRSLKFFYILLISINTIAIYYSSSRGAILAAIIGIGMMGLMNIFGKINPSGEKLVRKVILSSISIFIILSVSFVSIRNADFIKHDRTLSRFATMFSDDSVQNRINTWKFAWEGIKERPILGWGQENFKGIYTVNSIPVIREQIWFDRAHNIVIDWLVNAGVLGLFSYLAIYGAVYYVLWNAFQKKTIPRNEALTIVIALNVYFIQNLFTFDTINSYVLFIALLAYLDNIYYMKEATDLNKFVGLNKAIIKSVYVILPSLLLFSIVIYHVNYKPFKESQFIQTINSSDKDKSYSNVLDDFKSILSLRTFGDDNVRQIMSSMSFSILHFNFLKQPGALDFIERTVEELEKGIDRNRFNLDYLTDVMLLYNYISRYEPSFIDHTESLIRASINLNPRYERLYFLLADTLARKKDYEEAIEIVNNIVAHDPVNDIKYFELALIAILSSRDDIASSALEKLKAIRMTEYDYSSADNNIPLEAGELRRLSQIYLDTNRFYDAIHSYQQLIAYLQDNSPEVALIHFKMANIFHIVGDRENAVKEVKKAAEIDPENFAVKVAPFINSLNN